MKTAIRGIENLDFDTRYVKVYTGLYKHTEKLGRLISIEGNHYYTGKYHENYLVFENGGSFASDCGVIPYNNNTFIDNGNYNDSNYLISDPIWRKFSL